MRIALLIMPSRGTNLVTLSTNCRMDTVRCFDLRYIIIWYLRNSISRKSYFRKIISFGFTIYYFCRRYYCIFYKFLRSNLCFIYFTIYSVFWFIVPNIPKTPTVKDNELLADNNVSIRHNEGNNWSPHLVHKWRIYCSQICGSWISEVCLYSEYADWFQFFQSHFHVTISSDTINQHIRRTIVPLLFQSGNRHKNYTSYYSFRSKTVR